jgi:hypothetical protein
MSTPYSVIVILYVKENVLNRFMSPDPLNAVLAWLFMHGFLDSIGRVDQAKFHFADGQPPFDCEGIQSGSAANCWRSSHARPGDNSLNS